MSRSWIPAQMFDMARRDFVNHVALNDVGANSPLVIAAAQAGSCIVLVSLFMMVGTSSGSIKLEDSDNTALSGVLPLEVLGVGENKIVLPCNPFGWVKTASDKGLQLVITTAGTEYDGMATFMRVQNS